MSRHWWLLSRALDPLMLLLAAYSSLDGEPSQRVPPLERATPPVRACTRVRPERVRPVLGRAAGTSRDRPRSGDARRAARPPESCWRHPVWPI